MACQRRMAGIQGAHRHRGIPPNLVAVYGESAPTTGLADAVAGSGGGVGSLPPVSALLEVVDDPELPGDLVSLWALHAGSLHSVLRLEDSWPADADLPEFTLAAAGMRLDGDVATSFLVRVYDDGMAAIAAHAEMRARLPDIARTLDAEPMVALQPTSNGGGAVFATTTDRLPAEPTFRPMTGYHRFTRLAFLNLRFDLIGPNLR